MRNPFDKIKFSQLFTLCNIIAGSEFHNVSNIKRKYLERGKSFDETITFLQDLKIVSNNSEGLNLSKSIFQTDETIDEFKKKFLITLFSSNRNVSEVLRSFLVNFQAENDQIFFNATELQKIKFSSIRNLLLELEFISTSADNCTYYVNPEFADLFLKQLSCRKLSPQALKEKQIENESIGLSAEKVIIEYELKRLAVIDVLQNEIEHISLEDVLAGYDIKSFEDFLDNNSKRIDRFIEVKAVSADDFKFYWSRNEMEIAKILGDKYFIYLLPIIASNTFDTDKMLIINNPFKYIYSNVLEWNKQEESISFSKV